jgi:hypothetical protein
MASPTDDPIGRDGGFFQVSNPTVSTTPSPADEPGPLPSSRAAVQVGEPLLISVDNPPGT